MKPLAAAARPARPEFDVHLTENVMVPKRDGVRMATDIYRPARAGRPLEDRRPVLAADGADTIAWIRKQEWCDGTVTQRHVTVLCSPRPPAGMRP